MPKYKIEALLPDGSTQQWVTIETTHPLTGEGRTGNTRETGIVKISAPGCLDWYKPEVALLGILRKHGTLVESKPDSLEALLREWGNDCRANPVADPYYERLKKLVNGGKK